jgi:hypothetical protein
MAGRVPLRHFGSLHSKAAAAAGGTPLTQLGSVQARAPADVAARLSEPAARAAEINAPAATGPAWVFGMVILPAQGPTSLL